MKVLIIQKDINDTDWEAHLAEADLSSVDLICFGELAASGCLYEGGEGIRLDSILQKLAEYKPAIMLGFPRRTDGALHNCYLYHHDGKYQLYDKINLFEPMNEPDVYQPGREPGVFETAFGRLGVAICYDLRFSELFHRLKRAGAEKIFVPAAFPMSRIDDWKRLLVERAVENEVWIVGINAVGDDGRNLFGGNSMVVAPDGRIVAGASEDTPEYLSAEI